MAAWSPAGCIGPETGGIGGGVVSKGLLLVGGKFTAGGCPGAGWGAGAGGGVGAGAHPLGSLAGIDGGGGGIGAGLLLGCKFCPPNGSFIVSLL